jgi:hypothetical protein
VGRSFRRMVGCAGAGMAVISVIGVGTVAMSSPAGAKKIPWSVVPTPNPSPSHGSHLDAVTCPSASNCLAVGAAFDGPTGNDQAVAELWNGSAWSIVNTPSNPIQGQFLSDVTCVSNSDCWAVGTGGGQFAQTLVLHWSGSAWSVVATPNISPSQDSSLRGVACVGTADCWAVGFADDGKGGPEHNFAEHWNGSGWSIVGTPNTSPSENNALFDVACTSGSDCWAVGGAVISTLAEHWNGTNWSIVGTPNFGRTQRFNELQNVTCVTTSDCWSVGTRFAHGGQRTLAEHWNGTAWALVTTINRGGEIALNGISCASSPDCWAVGIDINVQQDSSQTVLEHWNGRRWSRVAGTGGALNDVQCVTSADCWAVGDISVVGVPEITLAEKGGP